MKSIVSAIAIFFIALFVYTKLAGPIPFSVSSVVTTKTDTFTVTGEGKASASPDVAVVNAGVTAQGATVKQVQQELNTKINAVNEAVKKLGVDARDIQTTNYNISPTYDYQSSVQRITGYQANTNVTVKVRDLDRANEVIDAATASGANQVGGISFELSDKSKTEDEARQKAVTDAKNKAEMAAKTAGFTLGRIINYSENVGGMPPVPYFGRAEMAMDTKNAVTQVEPGSTEITVSVNLSYELQ